MLFFRKKTRPDSGSLTQNLNALSAQLDAQMVLIIRQVMADPSYPAKTPEEAVDLLIARGALDPARRDIYIRLAAE